MNSISAAKMSLGILLTSLFVAISYEVKVPIIMSTSKIILVALSVLLSDRCANWLIDSLLGYSWGRKVIMRQSWIEGPWLLETHASQPGGTPKKSIGILQFFYRRSLELDVSLCRGSKTDYTLDYSSSEMAFLQESDLQCIIYFRSPGLERQSRGVAIGKFTRDDNRLPYPNRYEGIVLEFDTGKYKKQKAHKLRNKEVKDFRNRHGDKWEQELLKSKRDVVQSNSNAQTPDRKV